MDDTLEDEELSAEDEDESQEEMEGKELLTLLKHLI